MKIRNHKLDGVEFMPARWMGGKITPEIVILHDTAGRLEKGNSASYLANNTAKTSVHFVIERDGTISQLVPTNRAAWHAGQSSYHGRAACNDFSIGIELVNAGKMFKVGTAPLTARAWWKQTFTDGDGCDLAEAATAEHGAAVWMDYTPEQITAATMLLDALFRDIPTLRDITTHWYVSPGRKVDTNPLFPLEAIRSKVLGRDDPEDKVAEVQSDKVAGASRITAIGGLNMRRWPNTANPNVILTIPNGTEVLVERAGVFSGRPWLLVTYGGQTGWVVESYTQSI